jgi:hypothetical protein
MKYFKLLPSARETANVNRQKIQFPQGRAYLSMGYINHFSIPLEKYKQLQR